MENGEFNYGFSQLGVIGRFYSQSKLCHRNLPLPTGQLDAAHL